ncbi:UNVERIFIED_CONTAM: hypothetical protein Sindi_0454000 [Sesamum indicum]
MDRACVAILILGLYICSSAAQAHSVDSYIFRDETNVTRLDGGDHIKERPICELVSNFITDCTDDFYLDRAIRDRCCREVSRISHGCLSRSLRRKERDLLGVMRRICTEHSSPLLQPLSLWPQPSSPQPSLPPSPSLASVPKPKQPNRTPPASSPPQHRYRPRNCLVETVLFDSCDPRYPEANKNATRTERGFAPQSMSTGLLKDSAGCCLGFAVFTNDCNPTIKDLSFAKQRFYSRLQESCGQFQ